MEDQLQAALDLFNQVSEREQVEIMAILRQMAAGQNT